MKADYGLSVDPRADVEDISTKGHRTYTFEQPSSLGVDELNTFFELAWEKYSQHFAVILLGSVTGLRPSSLYALRRSADRADVKWDQSAHKVQAYLGLTPGEDSSPERQRRTSITKAGSTAMRDNWVQAAWVARRSRRTTHWSSGLDTSK